MPAIECENGKWKWGENGSCVYNSEEEAQNDNENYRDMNEQRDMTSLNQKGYDNAEALIKAGKYNTDSDWDFTAADGNQLLGDDDWNEYSKWFLAFDDEAEEETKGRYGYPFGKNGEVYRKALIATRQYAGRFKLDSIFQAAGRLIDMIDENESGIDINEKRHIISVKEDEKTITIVYEKDMHDDDYESPEEDITEDEEIIEDVIDENNIKIWDKKFNNIAMEKRVYNIENRVEKRDDGKEVVVGHASIYDSRSENLGGFYEYIAKGAFTEELIKKSDVRALINHDPNLILARNTSGTLKLEADEKGLRYEFAIPDTSYGRDLAINLKNGNINQSSFAFIVA